MTDFKVEKACEQIIERLLREGYRYQVTLATVEKAIMLVRGADQRTVNKWIRTLITLEYLTHEHHGVFKINILKIPHLIEFLKNHPQAKLQ